MASRDQLSTFFAGVERRACMQAVFAARDDEAAPGLVQGAMPRLAERYVAIPLHELPLLFQRMPQNAIRDWARPQRVGSVWTTLLSTFVPNREGADDADPPDTREAGGEPGTAALGGPVEAVEQNPIVEIIEAGMSRPAAASTQCTPAAGSGRSWGSKEPLLPWDARRAAWRRPARA